jgi:hypothetical protein
MGGLATLSSEALKGVLAGRLSAGISRDGRGGGLAEERAGGAGTLRRVGRKGVRDWRRGVLGAVDGMDSGGALYWKLGCALSIGRNTAALNRNGGIE